MPGHPLVASTLVVLPEILSQPEWKHHTEWRREHGFDLEEIQPDSLAFSVLGPWLSRLLDEHRAEELVGRLLAVVDEFLTSDDPGARAAAAGLVEHWLFRLGGWVATAALLGPATTDLLASLRARWAPWRRLLTVLEPFFEDLVDRVKRAYPGLHGGTRVEVDLGPTRFRIYAGFIYAPATQRFEDLLVSFDVSRDNVVSFELSRGSGAPLAPEFEPLVLPGEPGDGRYDEALMECAEAAMAFTREHLETLLPRLASPYDVE